ncbi:P-loop containing nucleoside triphosphate hydrolase protein [Xylaria flabelliformis]|nr:P-loop containing nucleoside triphosphate hydrolase protein [Xylaria flabelliformis]
MECLSPKTIDTATVEAIEQSTLEDDPQTLLEYDSDTELQELLLETPGEECVAKNVYEGPPKCKCCINWVDEYPDDIKKVDAAENLSHALIIRNKKSHGSAKPLEVYEIVVQSPFLKQFLRDAIPKLDFHIDNIVLKRPFEDAFHHWADLKEVARRTTDTKALDHIKLLLNILRRELKETAKQHSELLSKSLMTFDYLWTLFKPGELIFGGNGNSPQMYKLEKTEYDTDSKGNPVFDLRCSVVDWDGDSFGRKQSWERIRAFGGLMKITSLPFYPARFIEDHAGIRDRLLTRGNIFASLAGPHYKTYRGTAIQTRLFFTQSTEGPIHVDGRVIIDAKVYYQYNPSKSPGLEPLSYGDSHTQENADNDSQDDEKLTEEQLLICVPTVKGYALAQKSWVELSIDKVTDIVWNQNVFKNLILPSRYKDLVLSFVESQLAHQQNTFDDFIEGKGQGIVMLLAGAPGIGKTLTAESVAEEMHAPLYSVTAGELGSEISEIEGSLGKIMDLAARWNAVLLLDEADVYLAERAEHDIERNKLVSIFLRTLEYYRGILFITTNRAGSIDAAFKSRIHLSLKYPALTQSSQKEIWRNFINRSPVKSDEFTEDDFDFFAGRTMNGREIKNAVKLSHLLAGRHKEPLRPSHVKGVLSALYDDMDE